MNYWQYRITTEPRQLEMLLAFLSELPFDTFEETEMGWNAYLPENEDDALVEMQML